MRLDEAVYSKLRSWAKRDKRPLSKSIETAALRFIEKQEVVDEFELHEVEGNEPLNLSDKRGLKVVNAGRERFVTSF